MPEDKFEKYISKLDSDRFGFKTAKTDFTGINPLKTMDEFKKLGVKFIISRIDSRNLQLINELEDLGFRIKDNQLTYKFSLDRALPPELKGLEEFKLREVLEKDIPVLVKITEDSFYNYGHYFSDEKLDKNKCIEIYKDWVYRSCTDSNVADKVFVAEYNGEAAGYLSFKLYSEGNSKYTAGGLGSVSKRFRNKSVFRAITLHGLKWGKDIGLEWEEHNVLTTNFSVNRSFSKLGFRISASYVTLHGWLE